MDWEGACRSKIQIFNMPASKLLLMMMINAPAGAKPLFRIEWRKGEEEAPISREIFALPFFRLKLFPQSVEDNKVAGSPWPTGRLADRPSPAKHFLLKEIFMVIMRRHNPETRMTGMPCSWQARKQVLRPTSWQSSRNRKTHNTRIQQIQIPATTAEESENFS